MTGVYNLLMENATNPELFDQLANPADMYMIKIKIKIGRLAFVQLLIAIITIAFVAIVYCTIDVNNFVSPTMYRFILPDSLFAGLFGLSCSIFGLRVCIQKKGRCVFITYLVLTIMTAVIVGISILVSILVSMTDFRGAVLLILIVFRILIDVAHFIVSVVSSAMVCSIWSRMGGCCGSGSEPPVVYIQRN